MALGFLTLSLKLHNRYFCSEKAVTKCGCKRTAVRMAEIKDFRNNSRIQPKKRHNGADKVCFFFLISSENIYSLFRNWFLGQTFKNKALLSSLVKNVTSLIEILWWSTHDKHCILTMKYNITCNQLMILARVLRTSNGVPAER